MNIRKANLDEFHTIWRGGESAGNIFGKHLKSGTAEFWIVEKDNKIIGRVYFFTILEDIDFADGRNRAYITNFYVNSNFRGQGIGTRLMESIFAKLIQSGFAEATIGVSESEIKNVQLYERLGFLNKVKKCNIDPICVAENGNAIAMDEFLLLSKYL